MRRPEVAVVAGVGPGLGAAIARKLAREGLRVGLFARSADSLLEISRTIPGQVLTVPTDLTDPGEVREGFHRIRDQWGPVDVLVYHAGQAVWKPCVGLSAGEFESA